MSDKIFYLLQVNDALFPIGGYSHSQGLETYIQKGIVKNEETAVSYIQNKLRYSFANTELLGVRLSYEAAQFGRLDQLEELEQILEASRIPSEQRDASKKMGSRFMKTVEKLEISELKTGIFSEYQTVRYKKTINHCIAYGVYCAALGIRLEEAMYHFLYAQTSAMVTNCVKTIPLSQSVGQKILVNCYQTLTEILINVMNHGIEDFCLSAPGFDIRGMQHETLYSRIYMS